MAAGHIVGIDALRGLAVLLVWCHHVFAYTGVEIPLAGRLGGLLGVQLFFVISGYLIVRSASRERLHHYALRRVLRIYPAYWAVVGTITLISPRVTRETIAADPFSFLVNLAALSHFWPPALQRFDVTTVNWTLAVEIAWYATAPALVWVASRGRTRIAWSAIGAAALVLSTWWVVAAHAGQLDAAFSAGIARAGVEPVDDFMRFAYIVNLAPAHLVFFAAGAMVLAFEPQLRRAPRWVLLAAIAAFVPLADRWNVWLGVNPSFASGLGLTALFVWWASRGIAIGNPLLRALAHLGQISYPVYLIHVPTLLATEDMLRALGWGAGARIAAAALATLALSTVVHRLVEQPGIALGRSLSRTDPK